MLMIMVRESFAKKRSRSSDLDNLKMEGITRLI